MRTRRALIAAFTLLALLPGNRAQATVKHHWQSPRCAFAGVAVRKSAHRYYSVCEFRWDGQAIRVTASRLGPHWRFKPLGTPGRSARPSSLLQASRALAGTNGDYVVQRPVARMTDHLWIRDGRVLHRSKQAGIEFVQMKGGGAWIGREGPLLKHHPHPWEAFGGFPVLVVNGANKGRLSCTPANCKRSCGAYHCDNPLFDVNPRTAMGVSRGCEDRRPQTICLGYLVTVDGRLGAWSRGLRFPALAQLMIRVGAYDAMNTDGGGSTVMWMRHPGPRMCQLHRNAGCLLDRPSYGERTVVQAIGVVPV